MTESGKLDTPDVCSLYLAAKLARGRTRMQLYRDASDWSSVRKSFMQGLSLPSTRGLMGSVIGTRRDSDSSLPALVIPLDFAVGNDNSSDRITTVCGQRRRREYMLRLSRLLQLLARTIYGHRSPSSVLYIIPPGRCEMGQAADKQYQDRRPGSSSRSTPKS